jgi:hypothetical protein
LWEFALISKSKWEGTILRISVVCRTLPRRDMWYDIYTLNWEIYSILVTSHQALFDEIDVTSDMRKRPITRWSPGWDDMENEDSLERPNRKRT